MRGRIMALLLLAAFLAGPLMMLRPSQGHPCCSGKTVCPMMTAKTGSCAWKRCTPDAQPSAFFTIERGLLPDVGTCAPPAPRTFAQAALAMHPIDGFAPTPEHPPRLVV
jgi:hypothetical protein